MDTCHANFCQTNEAVTLHDKSKKQGNFLRSCEDFTVLRPGIELLRADLCDRLGIEKARYHVVLENQDLNLDGMSKAARKMEVL